MNAKRAAIAEKYIQQRFSEAGEYYKEQWRQRFQRLEEWQYSDFGGRRLLQRLDPSFYPADINAIFVKMHRIQN